MTGLCWQLYVITLKSTELYVYFNTTEPFWWQVALSETQYRRGGAYRVYATAKLPSLVPFAEHLTGLKLAGLSPAKCPAKSPAKKLPQKSPNSDLQVSPCSLNMAMQKSPKRARRNLAIRVWTFARQFLLRGNLFAGLFAGHFAGLSPASFSPAISPSKRTEQWAHVCLYTCALGTPKKSLLVWVFLICAFTLM